MIRRQGMFISDDGNYILQGTEAMVKSIYDSDKLLFKMGIYEEPTDQELIKFLKDLELYFYGGKKIVNVNHKGKDNKEILKELDL